MKLVFNFFILSSIQLPKIVEKLRRAILTTKLELEIIQKFKEGKSSTEGLPAALVNAHHRVSGLSILSFRKTFIQHTLYTLHQKHCTAHSPHTHIFQIVNQKTNATHVTCTVHEQ
jgi:uncharacterized membrane protein YbaN (DUF454 family)